MHHYLTCSCGEKWVSPDEEKQFVIVKEKINQTTFGSRSIKFEGARLWNHLPEKIKSADNLNIFKNLIRSWMGPSCGCNYCQFSRKS